MPVIRVFLLLLLFYSGTSQAVIETYEFSSGELEVRYRQMSQELRCPKCQNQNIADSNAPIAQDLRKLLHEQLEAGATDAQIQQFMVSRYGEFVLYRPRFSGATRILWLAPILLLLCAGVVVFMSLRRRDNSALEPDKLSEQEQQRLRELLDENEDRS
ncbi:MAG: cytochrome c-type biogenesis protein [Halioglobus sp.]